MPRGELGGQRPDEIMTITRLYGDQPVVGERMDKAGWAEFLLRGNGRDTSVRLLITDANNTPETVIADARLQMALGRFTTEERGIVKAFLESRNLAWYGSSKFFNRLKEAGELLYDFGVRGEPNTNRFDLESFLTKNGIPLTPFVEMAASTLRLQAAVRSEYNALETANFGQKSSKGPDVRVPYRYGEQLLNYYWESLARFLNEDVSGQDGAISSISRILESDSNSASGMLNVGVAEARRDKRRVFGIVSSDMMFNGSVALGRLQERLKKTGLEAWLMAGPAVSRVHDPEACARVSNGDFTLADLTLVLPNNACALWNLVTYPDLRFSPDTDKGNSLFDAPEHGIEGDPRIYGNEEFYLLLEHIARGENPVVLLDRTQGVTQDPDGRELSTTPEKKSRRAAVWRAYLAHFGIAEKDFISWAKSYFIIITPET